MWYLEVLEFGTVDATAFEVCSLSPSQESAVLEVEVVDGVVVEVVDAAGGEATTKA